MDYPKLISEKWNLSANCKVQLPTSDLFLCPKCTSCPYVCVWPGSRARLKVLGALGFYMLSHAIWALFLSILIKKKWDWKKHSRSKLWGGGGGGEGRLLHPLWIRNCVCTPQDFSPLIPIEGCQKFILSIQEILYFPCFPYFRLAAYLFGLDW